MQKNVERFSGKKLFLGKSADDRLIYGDPIVIEDWQFPMMKPQRLRQSMPPALKVPHMDKPNHGMNQCCQALLTTIVVSTIEHDKITGSIFANINNRQQ